MSDAEREIARLLILEGKGWHDEDGVTVVDSIDVEGGVGYPVKYHWQSGGAGADSIEGFLRNNYLPMQEVVRVAGARIATREKLMAAETEQDARLSAVQADLAEAERLLEESESGKMCSAAFEGSETCSETPPCYLHRRAAFLARRKAKETPEGT